MPSPRPRVRTAPPEVTVRRPDALAWRHAKTLAAGEPRRLVVLLDGSVVVHNKPAR